MRSKFRQLLVVSLLLCLLSTAVGQSNTGTLELSLLQQSNAERARFGLAALSLDASLSEAAQLHALEMAELGYLAHESPRAETRTLALRLNRTGAVVQAAGENLALLSGQPDVAAAAVAGWMDSPAHRQNLLGDFSHVGFGAATSPAGTTYVVQVLGLKTVEISSATLQRELERVFEIEISYSLPAAREVAFWLGEDVRVPGLVGPGAHTYSAEVRGDGPLHVNSATRPVGSVGGDVYVAADSGWFDPAAGTWSPVAGSDSSALRIDGVRGGQVMREALHAVIRFERPPAGRVGVWLAGEWVEDADWNGTTLSVMLPAAATGTLLTIGAEDDVGSGVYSILVDYLVSVTAGGHYLLLPQNPGS